MDDTRDETTSTRTVTADDYKQFVAVMKRKKKVETRNGVRWEEVDAPYMTVAGRIQWAIDDHRASGAKLHITTSFLQEPISQQLLCRAEVESTLLGKATGHARAVLNGTGADATNPLENAETSALGRALGMLGYGLVEGPGLASAEDMVAVKASALKTDTPKMYEQPAVVAVSPAISPAERTEQPKSLKQMWAVVRGKHKADETAFRGYCTALGVQSTTELTGEQIATVIAIVEHEGSAAFAPFVQLEKVATLPDEGWRKTLMKETAQLYALEGDSELVQQCIKVLEDVQSTPGTANHLRHKIADTMLVAQEAE